MHPPGASFDGWTTGTAIRGWLDAARARLTGAALPLLLLRGLVILASLVWLGVAPPAIEHPDLVARTLQLFVAYGLALSVLLWHRPAAVLRWNVAVLAVDLAFALAVIRLTGGTRSVFFLALYLIVALQAYYYGLGRGLGVAVAATLLYLAAVWPTLDRAAWADDGLRSGMLLLTAAGLGLLGQLEAGERRRIALLNQELAARERFARDVLESSRDGVVLLDRERRVAAWNQVMTEASGIPAEAAVGRALPDLLPGLGGADVADALERVYAGGEEGFRLERVRLTPPRGDARVLDLKGTTVHAADGRFRGLLLILEDETSRAALEASLRQSDKLAGLGTLAAGLAHEINNPIGVISARAELMLEDADRQGLDRQAREDLDVIRTHARRVSRITQGLLSFARRGPGIWKRLDVNQVVRDTLLLARPQIERAGITVRVQLQSRLPPVEGDPTLLGQVVLNLLTNARDAITDGGQIEIRTEPDPRRPGRLRLSVRDTGVGIPEAQLGRIFEPFFTTKPNGTGLGLAVCYGIVRDHRGVIEVESHPGEGTVFVVTLPGVGSEGDAGRGWDASTGTA